MTLIDKAASLKFVLLRLKRDKFVVMLGFAVSYSYDIL